MSKSGLSVAMTFVVAAVLLCAPVRQAHAVATVQVNVSGQALGETTLRLTDDQGQVVKEDEDSDRAAGFWWYRNKRPGTYTLQVLRNGVPVGPPQRIQVIDNRINSFRADATGGQVATVSSAFAAETMPQYSVGLMGGWKPTPWDGAISSTAGNFRHSGSLDESVGVVGVEGRYYLSPVQQRMQALGAGLFITGTYFHYLGRGLNRLYGDEHPPGGTNDVGVGMEENWSLMLGVGKQFNLAQRLGAALMIGAHMTSVQVAALADESGGGGSFERFRDRKMLFGPFLGLELFYNLGMLYALAPVQFVLQSRMLWMPDTTVTGHSNFTNWDYHAEADGGPQVNVMAGFRLSF